MLTIAQTDKNGTLVAKARRWYIQARIHDEEEAEPVDNRGGQ